MKKRIKESGHSFRVKRAKLAQETAELRSSMDKFVNIAQKTSSSTTENRPIETNDFESSVDNFDSIVAESANHSETQSGDEQCIQAKPGSSTSEK